MGGVDKGLQHFNGVPLALHALHRLRPQVGTVMLNANRNIDIYESFGALVVSDASPDFAGPLAGILAGLKHCKTPWLITVPCDAPLFPPDLVSRLGHALLRDGADIATACSLEEGELRTQPVFSLMRLELLASLGAFTRDGGRKVGAWIAQHRNMRVPFDAPAADARAVCNDNTLAELQALEH